jgi:hypothetical protein
MKHKDSNQVDIDLRGFSSFRTWDRITGKQSIRFKVRCDIDRESEGEEVEYFIKGGRFAQKKLSSLYPEYLMKKSTVKMLNKA